MNFYKLIRPLMFCLDSEKSHNLAINYLKFFPNLVNIFSLRQSYENLEQEICGLKFKGPVGLAAGFDKNAQAIKATNGFGFGFIEVGTVTPKPQAGNQKPRLFRLAEDGAIINRLGFNNKGSEVFAENIKGFKFAKSLDKKNRNRIVCGINVGKNKNSVNNEDDYLLLLEKFYDKASYITINISSPNTKNLREIQEQDHLDGFLGSIMSKKNSLKVEHDVETPIFLKVAPDLEKGQVEEIAKIVLKHKVDGVIISNTTISRDFNLKSEFKNEEGGLSGKPLFEKSNKVLSDFYRILKGRVLIIAVGGISDSEDVYKKIKLGANLVQIYSALIYEGFGVVEEINEGLSRMIKRDGFLNISQAVGSQFKK
jgi:dihydroorotate dehydrogenase